MSSNMDNQFHYSDVIMGAMASQTIYSGADQRKYHSYASLAFVLGIHRGPVNSPHKWPVNAENVSIWWRHHVNTMRHHWVKWKYMFEMFEGVIQTCDWIRYNWSLMTAVLSCIRICKLVAWRHQLLPKSMLTFHQWGSVALNWDQFHSKCSRSQSLKCFWKLVLKS